MAGVVGMASRFLARLARRCDQVGVPFLLLEGDGKGTTWKAVARKYLRKEWEPLLSEGGVNAAEQYVTELTMIDPTCPLTRDGRRLEGITVVYPADGDPTWDRYMLGNLKYDYIGEGASQVLVEIRGVLTHKPDNA